MTRPPALAVAALVAAIAAGCSAKERARSEPSEPDPEPAPAPANATPNSFLARGTPTFIVGTAGDDRADRGVAVQVELIRGIKFPDAPVVEDGAVDGWPERPVVYGGPHVNALLAKVADALPFSLGAGRLGIGGRTFAGDAYRLIAVVPAAGERPELLLYAGTGTPGVGEINDVPHGPSPILIADAFGPLVTGRWERGDDGAVRALLDAPRRRIEWRAVDRDHVTFWFPNQLPVGEDEADVIDACARGVARAVDRLAIDEPAPIDVYVYPDHRSKQSLTGNGGDGHAVVSARALHVVRGPGLENLVAHESTHLLGYEAWGPAATPLLGEGLAVWASGRYAGKRLADYRAGFSAPPTIAELLGPSFRRLPEPTSYPLAGLFVEVAIDTVGLDGVRDHLLSAGPPTWADACRRAGTTADALEAAFASYFDQ